jgi:exonuclease SbcD
MRALHTSDWHLGVTCFNTIDRRDDHDRVLTQILGLAKDAKVDVILHTGDLFESKSPSPDVLKYGFEKIDELAEIAPVLVVLGNHDGEGLFELVDSIISRRKSAAHPIHYVHRGTLRGANYGVFTLPTKDGNERIRIGACPFINSASYVHQIMKLGADQAGRIYSDQVGRLEAAIGDALLANYDQKTDINIFAAHLLVNGAVASGSERPLDIETDSFGTYSAGIPIASYLAFGHIHKYQPITGHLNGRYAGSCIQVDFGEKADKKYSVIIDAKPGLPAIIEEQELDVGRALDDPTIAFADLPANADGLRGKIIKLTLILEGHERNVADYVKSTLDGCYVAKINEVYRGAAAASTTVIEPVGPEPTVTEIFANYLATRDNVREPERVGRYFNSLYSAIVDGGSRQLAEVDAL